MSSFTRVLARRHAPRHGSIQNVVRTPAAFAVLAFLTSCATGAAVTDTRVVVAPVEREQLPSESAAEPVVTIETEPDEREEYRDARQTVFLLTRESSYFGDGSLDTYRTIVYGETGIEKLEQTLFSADGNVIERRDYTTRVDHTAGERVTEERVLDARGAVVTTWIRRYDTDGRLLDETQRDADGELQMRSSYAYGERGLLSKLEVYSSFAGAMGSTVFVYDGALRIRAESLGPNGALEELFLYEHDTDGRMVRRTHSTANGRVLGRVEYTYAGDLIVRETSYRPNGSTLRSVEYEYDDAGNAVVERHFDTNGSLRETVRREFVAREIGD